MFVKDKAEQRPIQYLGRSRTITRFLEYNHSDASKRQYYLRLLDFEEFVNKVYHLGVDDLLAKLECKKFRVDRNKVDEYDFIGQYLKHLSNKKYNNKGLAPRTIRYHITTVKNFIETETQIHFKPMRFRNKVKLPKVIKREKRGLPRETIIKLINGCVNPNQSRLRMILLFLAATSCRIGECLLLRISDLHLDGKPDFGLKPPYPPYVKFRGEITKTGVDRTTLLTNEMAAQLQLWISNIYKIRNRVVVSTDGKHITEKYQPEINENDFLFLNIDNKYDSKDAAYFVYKNLLNEFHALLESLKLTQRTPNGQYAITFHKIRMGVKTRISNSGFKESKEFSEFYMGHDTSTYYNPIDDDYKEKFKLCQNELTYLDQTEIRKTYGAIESRIDMKDEELAQTNKRILELEKQLSIIATSLSSLTPNSRDEIAKQLFQKGVYRLKK